MAQKAVYLYDDTNNVLKVTGIQVELYSTKLGTLLDKKLSADLNPPARPGGSSNEWGVKLIFNLPQHEPADIIITDASYKYPGNAVRHLYVGGTDRINVDLLSIPAGPGGQQQSAPSRTGDLARWVEAAPLWDEMEKEAVKNLIFNYVAIFVPRWDFLSNLPSLKKAATNWESALKRLEVSPETLRS
jgi:hypothetical protein